MAALVGAYAAEEVLLFQRGQKALGLSRGNGEGLGDFRRRQGGVMAQHVQQLAFAGGKISTDICTDIYTDIPVFPPLARMAWRMRSSMKSRNGPESPMREERRMAM